MKRTLLAIVAAFVMITSANAQRLTDIQAEARFITDKMIVELGLNSVQRNSLLNINLNYLDGIRSYRDIDAYGWHYRNRQLKRMLTARQWKRFKEAYYFYHPIGWNNNTYIYNIYNKYPKHNYRPDHPHYYGKPGKPYNGSTTRSTTTGITSTTRSAMTTTTSTTSTTRRADESSTTTHARLSHGERK